MTELTTLKSDFPTRASWTESGRSGKGVDGTEGDAERGRRAKGLVEFGVDPAIGVVLFDVADVQEGFAGVGDFLEAAAPEVVLDFVEAAEGLLSARRRAALMAQDTVISWTRRTAVDVLVLC